MNFESSSDIRDPLMPNRPQKNQQTTQVQIDAIIGEDPFQTQKIEDDTDQNQYGEVRRQK